MVAPAYCPSCNQAQVADATVCRSCGQVFDATTRSGAGPGPGRREAAAAKTQRQARIAVIVGGGLIAGAAFLPWASLGIIEVTGLRGDGIFAILIGVAIVAIMAASFNEGPSGTQRTLILVLSIAGLVLYGIEFNNVNHLSQGGGTLAPQVGSGILLGGVGALIAILSWRAIGTRR